MSASTPGPWIAVDDAQGPCMVMHPTNGKAIASLTDAHVPTNGFHDGDMAQRCANALLIAAAPDLLAAVILLTDIADNVWKSEGWYANGEDVAIGLNAIAKATRSAS